MSAKWRVSKTEQGTTRSSQPLLFLEYTQTLATQVHSLFLKYAVSSYYTLPHMFCLVKFSFSLKNHWNSLRCLLLALSYALLCVPVYLDHSFILIKCLKSQHDP